jgi:hypothetical protein
MGLGLCVLAAPELVVGAVIVAGVVVVVGFAIKEMKQLDKERKAAAACGYDFVVGVSTQEHKDALLQRDQFLNIVVTGCKR